jgi:hypothetical protein
LSRAFPEARAAKGVDERKLIDAFFFVNLTSVNTQLPEPGTATPVGFYMLPPATDPMAGIRCDQNAAFGGTTGVGRNELAGLPDNGQVRKLTSLCSGTLSFDNLPTIGSC